MRNKYENGLNKIMIATLLIATFAITGLAAAIIETSSASGGVEGKPSVVGGPVKPIIVKNVTFITN